MSSSDLNKIESDLANLFSDSTVDVAVTEHVFQRPTVSLFRGRLSHADAPIDEYFYRPPRWRLFGNRQPYKLALGNCT